MATHVRILIGESEQDVRFPEHCISCGSIKEEESRLGLKRLVRRDRNQVEVSRTYQIPHCSRCARATKAVFLAGCIPFVGGTLITGVILFFFTARFFVGAGLDAHGKPHNQNSLLVGVAAGLFGGLICGFVIELLARILFLPFFGTALLRAPMLARQLLTDLDYVSGVSGTIEKSGDTVLLMFDRDDVAREFSALNRNVVV